MKLIILKRSMLTSMVAVVCLTGCDTSSDATDASTPDTTNTTVNASNIIKSNEPSSSASVEQTQIATQQIIPPISPRPQPTYPTTSQQVLARKHAASIQANQPIFYDPFELHFGVLELGEAADGIIKVYNVTSQPLQIIEAKPGCECTTLTLPQRTIPPGQSVDINVHIQPKPGLGNKKVRVGLRFANHDGWLSFYVKAEITRPIRSGPPQVDARESNTGVVTLESMDGKPFNVLTTQGALPVFVGESADINTHPRNNYTLAWDLNAYSTQTMPGWWVIETDRPDCPLIDLRVWHEWTKPEDLGSRNWVLHDQHIVAGDQQLGKPFEIETHLTWLGLKNPDDIVRRITSESASIKVDFLGTKPDGVNIIVRMRITAIESNGPLIYGTLRIHTSRFSAPLTIIAHRVE